MIAEIMTHLYSRSIWLFSRYLMVSCRYYSLSDKFPAKDQWALPGGFADLIHDQDLMATAYRKLVEKTGISSPYLEQVASVGNAKRDRVVGP